MAVNKSQDAEIPAEEPLVSTPEESTSTLEETIAPEDVSMATEPVTPEPSEEAAPEENIPEPAAEITPVEETASEPPAEVTEANDLSDEASAKSETVTASPVTPKVKGTKPKWFFGAVAAGIVLLISGAAYGYFGVYLQSPENIWKSSLRNTREGLNAFVNKDPNSKKGLKIDGSANMTLPLAADATIKGSVYETSSDMTLDVGTSGIRANLALKTMPATGTKTPDVYAKISGVKGIAGLINPDPNFVKMVDSLDGQWLFADHTLVDQLRQSLGDTKSSGITSESPEQLAKDIQDISKKVAAVVNKRILTDDTSKAVVVIKDKLAKEDFKGRKSQHLRVQVQKTQLKDFVVELKDTLKSSKLNEWLTGSSGGSFEDTFNYDGLLKSIEETKYDNATADVWVDMEYRTIRNVRIYDSPSDTKNYVDLMFDYNGTDEYPFSLNVIADNSDGKQDVSVVLTINRKTDAMKLAVKGNGTDKSGKKIVDVTANFSLTPTDDKVNVEKPASSTNVVNLIGGLLGQLESLQNQLKVVNPADGMLDTSDLQ